MEDLSFEENPVYWGDYGDLYPTLSASESQSLEKAILARRLGRLQESQRIFEAKLPPPHLLPILALEKANLFSRLGLESSRYSVLDNTLRSQSQWRTRLSGREEELLSITCAEARLLAFGDTRRALRHARRVRDEWTDLAIDGWTDVEVSSRRFQLRNLLNE